MEEKSAVALVNYVPCIPQEAACIARLGAHCLVSWPDDSSSQEEEEGDEEEEEGEQEEEEEHEEQGEVGSKPPSGGMELEQGKTEHKAKPRRRRRLWEWGSIMDEEEHLTFNDPHLDSDATAGGCSPVCSTLQELGSPRETAVEVHGRESEVEEL